MNIQAETVNGNYILTLEKNGEYQTFNSESKKSEARKLGEIRDFSFIPKDRTFVINKDMNFDDFCRLAELIKHPNQETYIFDYVGPELKILTEMIDVIDNVLYTVVEVEGQFWISTGFHLVNRIGYMIGKNLIHFDNCNCKY